MKRPRRLSGIVNLRSMLASVTGTKRVQCSKEFQEKDVAVGFVPVEVQATV